MRRTLEILVIILLFPLISGAQEEKVFISGRVKHAKNKSVVVTYIKDYLYFRNMRAGYTSTDDDGNFNLSFKWEKPWLAQMDIEGKTVQLFLRPGDSINYTASYGNLSGSIKFLGKSGKGHNIQKAYLKKYKKYNIRFNRKMGRWDGEEFRTRNDANHDAQLLFISKDSSLMNENEELYAYLKAQVDYTYLNNVFDYCERKNQYFDTTYMNAIMPPKIVNNEMALPAVVYIEFLENYVSYKGQIMRNEQDINNNYWDYRYKVSKRLLIRNVRDLILARILKRAFEYTFHVTAMTLFYDYETIYVNPSFFHEIRKNFFVK